MPEQSVNDPTGRPAGRVGSVRPGRWVRESPYADMDGIRSGVRRVCAKQDPAAPPRAVTGRPPEVIWRFAPDDRSRLQRLLRLLFEQDTGQKQAGRW